MSVDTLNTTTVAQGDSSTTTFPITFDFLANEQIKVKTTTADVEAFLVEGVDFTLEGGNPATEVEMTTAPDTDTEVTVYRDTPKLQDTDYQDTGAFPAEAHEDALDKIVMMIQEVAAALSDVEAGAASAEATELTSQEVSAAEEITVGSSDPILVKRLIGAVADAEVGSIADGQAPWQRLTLIGMSDDLPVQLVPSATLILNGQISLGLHKSVRLFWDDTNSMWIDENY